MSDDFKKLDELMNRSRPAELAPSRPLPLPKARPWLLASGLSAGIALVLTMTVVHQREEKIRSADELREVLLWDVTEDETPAEVEESLEFIEG